MSDHDAAHDIRNDNFRRITLVLRELERCGGVWPGIEPLARIAGLSPDRLQHVFREWAGIPPQKYMQFLRKEYALSALLRGEPVLQAALDAGMTGGGRLHDLMITTEAVTPGDVRRRGAGLRVRFAFVPSRYGTLLAARTHHGLCHLTFLTAGRAQALRELQARLPAAEFEEEDAVDERLTYYLDSLAPDLQLGRGTSALPPLHLCGTNFQIKVWEALIRIPEGALVSYEGVAVAVGSGARAVAGAIANNPIAGIIPCHRVIRNSGVFHNYAGGRERKLAMIADEGIRSTRSTRNG